MIINSIGIAIGNSSCCAEGIEIITVTYKYKERSIVYYIKDAQKGVLNRLCIKSVLISNTYRDIIYKDTTNRIWMEDELCNEVEAYELVENYLERERDFFLESLEKCRI